MTFDTYIYFLASHDILLQILPKYYPKYVCSQPCPAQLQMMIFLLSDECQCPETFNTTKQRSSIPSRGHLISTSRNVTLYNYCTPYLGGETSDRLEANLTPTQSSGSFDTDNEKGAKGHGFLTNTSSHKGCLIPQPFARPRFTTQPILRKTSSAK